MRSFISNSVAQPYAKAIFDVALDEGALEIWDNTLKLLAKAAAEYISKGVLQNPNIEISQKIGLFAGIVGSKDFPRVVNLIQLLATRKKLRFLPEIAESYQKLLFVHNGVMEIRVVSAVELTAEQKKQLSEKIALSYEKKFLFEYEVDGDLIGGVVIYSEDRVIDNSIRGMLQRLKENLLAKSSHA